MLTDRALQRRSPIPDSAEQQHLRTEARVSANVRLAGYAAYLARSSNSAPPQPLVEDAYNWAIGSLTYTQPISSAMQLTITGSAENRLQPDRLFYVGVATVDQQLGSTLKFETTVHRYKNWGELNPVPTQKFEIETGFIENLTEHQSLWVSFFRHYQNGAPNDQFSSLQLKYGVSIGRGSASP